MSDNTPPDARRRLLVAAADLISDSAGAEVPLRSICDRAGVTLPTLYHHFGNKDGLIEAVVNHGFSSYVETKSASESSGDPLADIERGWDAHVGFGLENPAFYVLMYGRVRPHQRPSGYELPRALLIDLVAGLAAQGRLAVPINDATERILAANIGTTLHLIAQQSPDLRLSAGLRDATLGSLLHRAERRPLPEVDLVRFHAAGLRSALQSHKVELEPEEHALFAKWLDLLTS